MSKEIESLTIAQKRVRGIVLLESEKAKLKVLVQQLGSNNVASSDIYKSLIEEQKQTIQRLEKDIQKLTDQLEGPELREQLKKAESSLKQAAAEILELKAKVSHLAAEVKRKNTKLTSVSTQFNNIMQLNESYIKQIALLSLHERQNAEDHASTVLTISHRLAELGINIPAKASVKRLNTLLSQDADNGPVNDNDEDSDPEIDQTIFSKSFRTGSQGYRLSLVINSITPDLDIQPIELKLTELDSKNHPYKTQTLEGFSTSDAVAAAETYATLYEKLNTGM